MGSASLQIEDTKADSQIRTIVFSGDLGNSPEPLEKATETFDGADAVIMESTYGDRLHPKENPVDIVLSEVTAVEKTGGTLLIPAFSLERTQEILHILMHAKKNGKIQGQTPIFTDSPMGQKATNIYMKYPGNFNAHIQSDIQQGSPFEFEGLRMVASPQESEAIHHQTGPKVIIAGGGMMTGGRIVGHAAYYLPEPSTRLLIVGFQGEGNLGRELLAGSREVSIDGVHVSVQATVSDTQAMSSHADQGQLISWLSSIKNVKKLFLTHGEDGPRGALAKKISEDLKITDISMPTLNQEVSL